MTESNLTPSDEKELKELEIRAGVKKVIYGTAIVGVAAAFFPFAQQASTEWFKFSSAETVSRQASIESSRAFLEQISDEGRSPNIDERIVLAEYYRHLSSTLEEQQRWKDYLQLLINQRDEKRKAELDFVAAANDSKSTALDVAIATTRAEQLQQSANPSGTANVLLPQSFRHNLRMLESEDTSIRRQARSNLSNLGIDLVRPSVAELKVAGISYRLRLGLLVALTEMMRENKSSRQEIIEYIDMDGLEVLVASATSTDRTTRIYAGEFLYDLGDERIYEMAADSWAAARTDEGKYNIALILKGAAPYVSLVNSDRALETATNLLGTVGPKTDKLLQEAISILSE